LTNVTGAMIRGKNYIGAIPLTISPFKKKHKEKKARGGLEEVTI